MAQVKDIDIVWRYLDDNVVNGDSIRSGIEQSDDYYFGRLPGPPPEVSGRSASVSMDCQSMVTATLASVMDGFTAGQPARFKEQGIDDDLQAELESTAVHQIIDSNDGYMALHSAVDSALRYQLAAMRVFVDEQVATEKRTLPDATAEQLAQLAAQIPKENDPVIKGETVSWQRTVEKVEVETIDISRLRYIKDFPSIDVQAMPFIAIEHRDLRKDLIDMGFDAGLVNKLPKWRDGAWTEASIRSKLVAEERNSSEAPVPELDWIQWYECWVQIPSGDGSTELRRIVTSHNVELDNTAATFIPIALGVAFPQGHRIQGISLVSKVIPTQISKTEARRQYEDNLAASNNPRSVAYDINLEDAMNGRIDGLIRAESPNFTFQPVPVQDLSSGSLGYLAYMDTVRAEVGGAALDMQQPESEALKSQVGAVATQSILASQEMLSAYITKNLAMTLVRSLWIITHRTLREDFKGQLQVPRADQSMQVQPSQWQARDEVILTQGMSPSQRNRKAANLATMIQTQMAIMQAGMPLTDPEGLHSTIRDWGIASDLGNINAYLTDPQSQKGQQMAQQQQQNQQQQQQMQQQMAGVQIQLEQGKLQMDKYKADLSAQVDVFKANLQAEVDEAKLTLEGIENAQRADIDAAQSQGQGIGQSNGSAGPAGAA